MVPVCRKWLVRILAGTSAILTYNSLCFPQFVQLDAGIVTQLDHNCLLPQFSDSLFINHPTIWCCMYSELLTAPLSKLHLHIHTLPALVLCDYKGCSVRKQALWVMPFDRHKEKTVVKGWFLWDLRFLEQYCWSSGLLGYCTVLLGEQLPMFLLWLLDPEDEGPTVVRNIWNYSHSDTA
jgi:hypothetical protein